MRLFVSSCAQGQVRQLVKRTGSRNARVINPQTICTHGRGFGLTVEDGETLCSDGGRSFKPDAIYWNSKPRADAALPPPRTRFVVAFRSRLSQFFEDLSCAFAEDADQFPGTLAAIQRAESKPWLFAQAREAGLCVPAYTWNVIGASTAEDCHERYGRSYRKVLGPPHVVTEDGRGVTTTNLATKRFAKSRPGANHPWQYQEIIPFVAQWRCHVVGNRVWASRWQHSPHGNEWDLRFHQEVLGEKPKFKEASLDPTVHRKVAKLVAGCHLSHAAPEFLERKDGSFVFIDLNPCGDWMGFFSKNVEAQIADALADLIKR